MIPDTEAFSDLFDDWARKFETLGFG